MISPRAATKSAFGTGGPKKISLRLVTVVLPQEIPLFGGFHALRDNMQPEVVSEGNDRAHNGRIVVRFD
jgi:hypothetical protein